MDMKRKNIFLIAFISIICIIGGGLLWKYSNDAKKSKAAHVVLIGEKIAHITYGNGMLSFLENNPKYCVWYVRTDKAARIANKQAIVVDDIMDKEKVIGGIKALAKQGLALDKIRYMLVLPNNKETFALQKDLHKEFNVKAGCTEGTMEDILAQYQAKGTHGQNEVHLVLKDGEKLVAKAMAYTTTTRVYQGSKNALYESYIVLGDKDKANALIDSAMKFAKAKQYANGGLTVYFDAQDGIKGIQPFSRLFPKLSYRNIFESYRPSKQEAYQGRVYYSIQPADDFAQGDLLQCSPEDIKKQCPTSLRSISLLEENEIKMVDNISLNRVSVIPVGSQVVIHLQNESRDTLEEDIKALTNASSTVFWSAEKDV